VQRLSPVIMPLGKGGGVTAKNNFGADFSPNSALENSVKDNMLTFLQ